MQVLENDATNVKALYRRAQAWMGSQDYLEAEQDIKAALEREPANKDVRALHKRCRSEQAVQNRKEAKLYSNLFAKMSKLPDLEPQVRRHVGPSRKESMCDCDIWCASCRSQSCRDVVSCSEWTAQSWVQELDR